MLADCRLCVPLNALKMFLTSDDLQLPQGLVICRLPPQEAQASQQTKTKEGSVEGRNP